MVMKRITGRGVPNLVIAQRVIDKMAAAAATHMEDETGEAMVGFYVPRQHPSGVPTLYALDTISPDDSAIRQFHTFQQGDDRQDDLIWWLQENWRVQREKHGTFLTKMLGSKWDVPLRYLGDWHKQPGFMIQPSGGDLMTAIDWIDDEDNNTDFLLAPIVTLDHPHTIVPSNVTTNFLMVPQASGDAMRVDFWYIDKQAHGFLPIAPTIYPNDQLPTLAEYPWHLVDDARFTRENDALQAEELFVSVTLYDTDETPPLEVCYLVGRMGGDKLLIIATKADYPKSAPKVRVAPFIHMGEDDDMYKVFEQAWKSSTPLDLHFDWTADHLLIDLIKAAEAKLGK